MSAYRFYVPDLLEQLPAIPGRVTLPDEEAHHARAVLRLEQGVTVILFDGKGAWSPAVIDLVSKKDVCVRVKKQLIREEKSAIQLTLCAAVPKGERADWLIEQASQLNVAAVQWLDCQRGVVRPREGGGKMEKWRRLAVESAKQCGRAHVMEIHEPVSLQTTLDSLGKRTDARTLWLDPVPGGLSVTTAMAELDRGTVTALIGPEGGWSDTELIMLESEVAARNIHRVLLTSTVLRIETACAAVAALVMAGPPRNANL